jgi:hypothetical protein
MNRGSDSILSVYSDARAEYTKQLCVFLVPAFFQFFVELLDKAKSTMINEPKKVLWEFQNYLNQIHDWNMEKVNNEIHRIQVNSGCDYLEDLLTAVFIAHTKVLTAIRLSSNKKKIEINVPKVEHFLFKVLCETSKLLWSSTYLFRDGISGIEKQQNYRTIEQLINEGILQAVRNLVPVKSILKDFVGGDTAEVGEEEEDSDDEETKEVHNGVIKQDEIKAELNEEIKQHSEQEINIPQSISIQDVPITPTPNPTPNLTSMAEETNLQSPPHLDVTDITTNENNVLQKPQNEIVQGLPQTIVIDDKPGVRFGEFDAVFDSDNPMDSDMVFDPKDEDDIPVLEILDEAGAPLSEGLDFDDLDEKKDDDMGIEDYEELN